MHKEFGDLPELQTARLYLRKLTDDDACDIFEYASNPEVTQYLMWEPHLSIEDSLEFIHASLDQYQKRQAAPWGIWLPDEEKIIGTCGFISWRPDHGRAEIGYALSRKYWGRGFMTEAAQKIIEYGFLTKEINRIQAMCEPPNTGSARVMEKAGMTYEGILRQYMVQHGEFCDMKIYSILKKEWEKLSSG